MAECFHLVSRGVGGGALLPPEACDGNREIVDRIYTDIGGMASWGPTVKCDIYYKCVWGNKCFLRKNPILGRELHSLTKFFCFLFFFPYLNHLIKSMFMNCGEMYLETTASLGKGQKKIKYSFKIHCLVENRRVQ